MSNPWWSLEPCRCESCRDDDDSEEEPSSVAAAAVTGAYGRRRRKLLRLFERFDVPRCDYVDSAKTWRTMIGENDVLYPLRVRILGGDIFIETACRLQGFVYGPFAKSVHNYRKHGRENEKLFILCLLLQDSEQPTSLHNEDIPIVDWLNPHETVDNFSHRSLDNGYRNVAMYKKLHRCLLERARARNPVSWFDDEAKDLFERWRLKIDWLFHCDLCRRRLYNDDEYNRHNRKTPGRGQRGRRRRYTKRKAAATAAAETAMR